MKQRIVLVIMDGWGIAKPGKGNAIRLAKTPNYSFYSKNFPRTELEAAGKAVGLPAGKQGNSEVGHLHLGAGRVVTQPLTRINKAIRNNSFFKNPALLKAIRHCKRKKSSLHLMGLCSDEGIHATTGHLFALLKLAKKQKFKRVFIHCFLDGRDVPEKSAKKYIGQIERETRKNAVGKIASVTGRYYSMDRDKNWNRTKLAYELLVQGKGRKVKSALEAVEQAYKKGDKTDYYVKPTAIVDNKGEPVATVKDKDSIIFFNFRIDRVKQLTYSFALKKFNKFKRNVLPKVLFVCFTEYADNLKLPIAFQETMVKNTIGEFFSKKGIKQLRIAETEKHAHVTYFFNSEVETPYKGEKSIEIPSSKVPSYDLKPEMSAYGIAKRAVKEISSGKYDFILVNFANCDLVGHSAVMKAVIKCVEVVDKCTGNVVKAAVDSRYTAVITADHGSAEEKIYPNGLPKPAHSCNRVPFIIVSGGRKVNNLKLGKGGLSDVAPTIIELMELPKPMEMTGKSLIIRQTGANLKY